MFKVSDVNRASILPASGKDISRAVYPGITVIILLSSPDPLTDSRLRKPPVGLEASRIH